MQVRSSRRRQGTPGTTSSTSPLYFSFSRILSVDFHRFNFTFRVQLVAEFKRLGSVIIFANFNKIIICTKKTHGRRRHRLRGVRGVQHT
ncbi:unnamed protein product [Nesidiocoris tenuis]|uniref:DNA polymerase epsilon catalytic subunit A C-terminal domain-containing protein n=1 Tax=Nesidiocoris tenuis TaxID=355587 RepID=A0A6H5GT23_9HEMI|nr:unnamed protein product [Nesidiocoris tenuis]